MPNQYDEKQEFTQTRLRADLPGLSGTPTEHAIIWSALSQTPGVGVSVTDIHGRLLFVNNTSLVLFEGHTNVDYCGKSIADFHSAEFTEERLVLLKKVVESRKPSIMRHIYLGRCIESTLWPVTDHKPPFNRVIVVSKQSNGTGDACSEAMESIDSKYIELGQLNVLTRRELEVFVMLGHGMGIPQIAKTLFRSPKTLERHKTSIAKKLSLKSQAEMVRLVTMLGLEYEDVHRMRIQEEPVAKVAPELKT